MNGLKLHKIWDILKGFKDICRLQGWKTSNDEDWVQAEGKYHNFLSAKNVHPSSFKKVAANRKVVVHEGLDYRVVGSSYTAWLFSETPPASLVKTVLDTPGLSATVALYDLSPMLEGKNACVKVNNTDSAVFQGFESFLEDEFKVKIKPVSSSHDEKDRTRHASMPELA